MDVTLPACRGQDKREEDNKRYIEQADKVIAECFKAQAVKYSNNLN